MLQNFIDIIAAPSAVFTRLKQTPVFWLPMALLLAATISTQLGYFLFNPDSFVRSEMVDQATNGRDITKEQRKQIEEGIAHMNVNTAAGVSAVAILIILPVVLCLNAWYLGFMARFSFVELEFKHWLSLLCWTAMPGLLAALGSWLVIATNTNGHLSQGELQPLSIASLLGYHFTNATLQNFNLTQLWALGLGVSGFRQWTGASWLKSSLIVLAPSIVIYGAILYFNH